MYILHPIHWLYAPVLDSSIGKPAAGVRVRLQVYRVPTIEGGAEIWESLNIG
jgi:5-hydroxyisourate hydrolase-like protein (transthyretin family)